jgi:hypothetical protein
VNQSIELKDEERTRCEIWTRVMGYHRPISAFNPGKQAEQAQRRYFIQLEPSVSKPVEEEDTTEG